MLKFKFIINLLTFYVYTYIMKIYVMKFLKYIKICMLLNRMRIFEIVQELDVAMLPRQGQIDP